MTTKNIIPQADGEGSIGIDGTSWASGVFNTGVFEEILVGGNGAATLPGSKLEIVDSNNHLNLKVADTISQSVLKFSDVDGLGAAINYDHNADKLHLITDGTATPASGALSIDSDGNVGIGTTSPQQNLEIKGERPAIRLNDDDPANQSNFEIVNNGGTLGIFDANNVGLGNLLTIKGGGLGANSGNVGIGTTSPGKKLHVAGNSHQIVIEDTDAVAGEKMRGIYNNNQKLYIGRYTDDLNSFYDDMVIDSTGKVGIGTTDPGAKLSVVETSGGTQFEVRGTSAIGGQFQINNAGGDIYALFRGAGSNDDVVKINTNGDSFFNGGKVGIGTTDPGATFHLKANDDSANALALWVVNKAHTNSIISAYENGDVSLGEFTYKDESGNVGIGTTSPAAKLDIDGDISISGAIVSSDSNGRVLFSDQGLMVGQAEVKPDPDNPQSLYFQAIPQVKDSEGNAVTVLTADKLGLGTSASLTGIDDDIKFKLLTDQQRFVVGTTGEYGLGSGWYRFNDFKVKGATDIGAHPINPVDTRIYSDESSFILFKTDTAGNRVAHLVGGEEEVSPNNAIALGIAVKVDNSESPEDIEFVHTDGESYSVINGNSDSLGTNGLPIRQGFQNASLGSNPLPLLIDGGSF